MKSKFMVLTLALVGILVSYAFSQANSSNTFTDSRDGKKYRTVTIGDQTWMAENLNYNASSSKCYNNSESNCKKYGRLYNWYTAIEVCPSGWHLPDKAEWDYLIETAGEEQIANKLKAKSSWKYGGNGQDTYGFTALPSGTGDSSGNFNGVGFVCDLWSSYEYYNNSSHAYNMNINIDNYYVGWGISGKDCLLSVRCVRN
jgi:uncharacterized protein (TIGR02145 family)